MYQKILVPIDGSDTSQRGLDEAIKLAKDQHAVIRLLHVVNEWMVVATNEGAFYTGDLIQGLREGGKALLEKSRAAVSAAGIQVETELVEANGGHAGHAIVKDAENSKADIIVLGTHGRRGLGRLLMGSDAEQVVREARVPVLLIRQPAGKR